MARTNQYITTMRFSYDELLIMKDAQLEVLLNGVQDPNESRLIDGLTTLAGVTSTILGMLFNVPASVTVASITLGLVSSLNSWEKNALEDVINDGYLGLSDVEKWYRNNQEFDEIEVKMSVLEYVDEGIYYVTHTGEDEIVMGYVDGRPVLP